MFLGIDIGTSAVKAVLADAGGEVRAAAETPLRLSTPRPYWCEQDPRTWWQAALTVCARLRGAAPEEWGAVRALGLSGQMHGAVLLDDRDRVIRPVILWNDGRAYDECRALAAECPDLATIAGVAPLPGFTAPQLMWLARHEPETRRRIARLLLPKDYLGLRLHGRHVTDPSDAAGTLLFDQQAGRWSEPLIAAAGIDPAWLPEIRPSASVAGPVTPDAGRALGLPAGLPVAVGAGDTAAGGVGLGAVGPGDAVISIGTSGQIFLPEARFSPDPDRMVHAFAHAVPGMWYRMAALLNGARPLEWFAALVGQPIGSLLDEAAAAPDAPLALPYLTGERTPHGDPHLRGAFWGLGTGTTRGDMMRSLVEGVAFSFRDGAEALDRDPLPPLLATGGGTRSDFLMQTVCDVLGTEIRRAADARVGPSSGAARLAAVAVGALQPEALARAPQIERRFTPDTERGEVLHRRLAQFRDLHRRLSAPVPDPGVSGPGPGASS
jgi:xylulokinase